MKKIYKMLTHSTQLCRTFTMPAPRTQQLIRDLGSTKLATQELAIKNIKKNNIHKFTQDLYYDAELLRNFTSLVNHNSQRVNEFVTQIITDLFLSSNNCIYHGVLDSLHRSLSNENPAITKASLTALSKIIQKIKPYPHDFNRIKQHMNEQGIISGIIRLLDHANHDVQNKTSVFIVEFNNSIFPEFCLITTSNEDTEFLIQTLSTTENTFVMEAGIRLLTRFCNHIESQNNFRDFDGIECSINLLNRPSMNDRLTLDLLNLLNSAIKNNFDSQHRFIESNGLEFIRPFLNSPNNSIFSKAIEIICHLTSETHQDRIRGNGILNDLLRHSNEEIKYARHYLKLYESATNNLTNQTLILDATIERLSNNTEDEQLGLLSLIETAMTNNVNSNRFINNNELINAIRHFLDSSNDDLFDSAGHIIGLLANNNHQEQIRNKGILDDLLHHLNEGKERNSLYFALHECVINNHRNKNLILTTANHYLLIKKENQPPSKTHLQRRCFNTTNDIQNFNRALLQNSRRLLEQQKDKLKLTALSKIDTLPKILKINLIAQHFESFICRTPTNRLDHERQLAFQEKLKPITSDNEKRKAFLEEHFGHPIPDDVLKSLYNHLATRSTSLEGN